MLIKEYRIPLPLSVEEYRIAQLYMIQKKSRDESSGAGSGIEIITNEPYVDGPGGSGQYTYKVYHIGNHLPKWICALLPSSALCFHEEAWNAYPYTKTRYKCYFIDKFMLEIETRYLPDGGSTPNLFNLESNDLAMREIDVIDFVNDSISSGDYSKDEDPKLFTSAKTGRGPLTQNWLSRQVDLAKDSSSKEHVMCAYKLCRVEFRYWGMQTKIERFIHDIALRKTMVRAHRQAWAWQDEYFGKTIDDIRQLEKEAQQILGTQCEIYGFQNI